MKNVTSDEYCSLILDYEDDISSIMKINSYSHYKSSNLRLCIIIHGTEGSLRYENGILSGFENQNQFLDMKDEFSEKLSHPFSLGTSYFGEALKKCFLLNEKEENEIINTFANFETSLYVQSVLDAGKKSNDTRSWVSIE